MANPRFIFGSIGGLRNGSTFDTVEMGRPPTVLVESHYQRADFVEALSGERLQINHHPVTTVRIVFDQLDDIAVIRKLYALEAYLIRGGYVAYANDSSNTFARITTTKPGVGISTIRNLSRYYDWLNDVSLADGDELVLESWLGTQTHLREYKTADGAQSVSAQTVSVDINEPTIFSWGSESSVLALQLRHRDLYPTMRLANQGQRQGGLVQPVRNRYLYRFEATFEYRPFDFD